ncbi:putative G antigen family E member 3 [Pteropus vampyrus]|uniref:G antigen family E member 3 n=1 Tax=Pteropus vampyrus TaxID=132908 RepID=A0A6P6C5W1_PTEVA|nr:putative G antigen family E member 3 [Pteropus vampyrus]
MSRCVRSRSLWNIIPEEQEPSEPVGPVVAQEPSDEKPEQKELSTQSHDITPDKEREDERPPDVEGRDPEVVVQQVAQLNIGDEGRHGPDVKEAVFQKAESMYMAEAGEEQMQD